MAVTREHERRVYFYSTIRHERWTPSARTIDEYGCSGRAAYWIGARTVAEPLLCATPSADGLPRAGTIKWWDQRDRMLKVRAQVSDDVQIV